MIEPPAESPDKGGNASHSQILQEQVGLGTRECLPASMDPFRRPMAKRRSQNSNSAKLFRPCAHRNQYRSRPNEGSIAAKACRHSGSRMNARLPFDRMRAAGRASTKSSTGLSSALPQRGQRPVSGISSRAPHAGLSSKAARAGPPVIHHLPAAGGRAVRDSVRGKKMGLRATTGKPLEKQQPTSNSKGAGAARRPAPGAFKGPATRAPDTVSVRS